MGVEKKQEDKQKEVVKSNKKQIKHDPQAESARAKFGKSAPEKK